jgi:iron complex outermembrane receptor protein
MMKAYLFLTTLLAGFGGFHTACASDLAEEDIHEVVVRGSLKSLAAGTAAPEDKIPFSHTVVDQEVVDRQGGFTLHDALRNVPGAQPDFSFTGVHAPVFTLRGAIADSGTGNSRMLRDGVRLSNYAYASAFVERLDVVRGAGALTAVRTEPGGTVNLVTKAPQLHDFARVSLQAGEHHQGVAFFDANSVLSASQGIATRLIVTRSQASKWRLAKDELNGLKWSLSKNAEDYQLTFDFEGTDQTYQPDFGIPGLKGHPADVPRTLQLGEPFADSTTRNRIYTLKGDGRLADDWRWSVSAVRLDSQQTSVRNSVSGEVAGKPGVFARVTAYEPYGKREIDTLQGALSGMFSTGHIRHHHFVGAEYQTETLDLRSVTVPAVHSPPIDIFHPVLGRVTAPSGLLPQSRTRLDVETRSLTVQDRMDIGKLGLVVGVQYGSQDFLYGSAGVTPVSEHRLNPKVGATYEIAPRQSLFVSYSEGMSQNQATSKSNQSLPSRRSQQIEAGWKGRLLTDELSGSLAVYQLDQSNLLADDATTANRFDKTIAGKGRSRGLEAALNGQVTPQLRLDLAYAWTNARYMPPSELAGRHMANTARHTASVFGAYAWTPHIDTGVGISGQSPRYVDSQNTTRLPGFVRVDLVQGFNLTAAGRPARVQINVHNLFDETYYVAGHLHVSRYILPAEGRSVSLSLSLDL